VGGKIALLVALGFEGVGHIFFWLGFFPIFKSFVGVFGAIKIRLGV